jgi:hypothetical protein
MVFFDILITGRPNSNILTKEYVKVIYYSKEAHRVKISLQRKKLMQTGQGV